MGEREGRAEVRNLLAPWPVARPLNWVDVVNAALMPRELERVGLEHTVRPEGRPRAERPGG